MKTSQEIMNGCGKLWNKGDGGYYPCEKGSLCPICQAQRQERLECYKKFVEKLDKSFIASHDKELNEIKRELKQEIKTLEGGEK